MDSKQLLMKHQTLHKYYMKQKKSIDNVAMNKEYDHYALLDKHDLE